MPKRKHLNRSFAFSVLSTFKYNLKGGNAHGRKKKAKKIFSCFLQQEEKEKLIFLHPEKENKQEKHCPKIHSQKINIQKYYSKKAKKKIRVTEHSGVRKNPVSYFFIF